MTANRIDTADARRERRHVRIWLLCLGSALPALVASSATAQAIGTNAPPSGTALDGTAPAADQPAAEGARAVDADGDAIVVTGLRAGIERSLDDKRRAINVQDVISAEDIGKFPDNNLAESLQRIPGITIDRSVNGEGQTINLRGLGSGFTRSEINGGTALNGFDFSVLAPELFSKITVEKSPVAKTVEGGLAGTIKEETPKPFDIPGFRATATSGVTFGQHGQKTPRFFGLVSKNWDDRYGITIAGAYSKTDFRANEIDYGPWVAFRNIASPEALATGPASLLDAATPRTTAYYSYQQKRQNYGATVAAQARPSDALELTADFLYASRRGNQIDDRPDAPIEGSSFFADGTNSAGNQLPTNYTVTNGAVTSGTFSNIQNRVGYSYQPQKNSVYQGTLRAKWQPTEHLTIEPGASYAHQSTLAELNLYSFAVNGANLTYAVNGNTPAFSSTSTDFSTDPQDYGFNVFIFNRSRNVIDEGVARLDFTNTFDIPGFQSLQWGGRYTDRKSTQRARSVGLFQGATLLGDTPAGLGAVSDTLPFRVRGANAPSRILSVDLDAVRNTFYPGLNPYDSDEFYNDPTQDALASFRVREKTFAGYVQGNFELGPVLINAGVRVIATRTNSTGTQLIGDLPSASRTKSNYTNFLPAINARYEIRPDLLFRGTYSRAMTRPTLEQLSPAVIVNSGPRTGTRGNPDLRPYLADQEDLGVEWYFRRGGLVTVTAFAKQIDSLIAQTVVNEETIFPDQVTGLPISGVVAFTQPTNGDRATVKGLEAGLQSPFYFLPGVLSGFGGILNYTYASSRSNTTTSTGGARTTALPGLSKHSANAVLYFDRDGVDMRLAYAYRSTYLRDDNVGVQFGAQRYIRGYGQLDLSVNWSVTRNFQLGLNVNNLLDTQRKEYILVDSGAKLPASLLEQERRFVLTGRVVL